MSKGYNYGPGEQEHKIFSREENVDLGKAGWITKGQEYSIKFERNKRYVFCYSSTNGKGNTEITGWGGTKHRGQFRACRPEDVRKIFKDKTRKTLGAKSTRRTRT